MIERSYRGATGAAGGGSSGAVAGAGTETLLTPRIYGSTRQIVIPSE